MTGPDFAALPPPLRSVLAQSVPALVVGVVSALVLYALDELAHLLQDGIWTGLPRLLGVDPASPFWIVGVLGVSGLIIGLVLWLMPGHGGHDSATTELIAPPLTIGVLPSLAIVTILGLASGVSLGPEQPIVAINTAILVALVARFWRSMPVDLTVMITAAGTIGAMFGTPVAAALVFTGLVGALKGGGALWDRLFLPLVSAGAGAATMSLIERPVFALTLPEYDVVAPVDVLSATVIAVIAAVIGLLASWVFPAVHRGFRMLGNPVLYVTAGGLLLGTLGAIGGPVTLFKGAEQMGELAAGRENYTGLQLVVIVVVKVVALIVSAAAGFRGGRIFPAVFIGVAIGVLANALLPGIPPTVAITGGVLGMVLAIARDGWIALFISVVVSGGVTVLPILCVAILPAWLLVSRGPEMIVHARERDTGEVDAVP